MNNKYELIIGMEIHVELKTKSKMFCQCDANYFGKEPNTNTCPVCLGLPGALPVPNKTAVEWTIKLAKALNCNINLISKFDRKHYSYPDLPKGYQISQYDEPIGVNGKLRITNYELINEKEFGITRVHLEEDTGKLTHSGEDSLIDFNRSSVPLVEIVTEPDFRSSEEVKQFLEELYTIIKYLDISDADMEKGSMRMEPNISVRLLGEKKLPDYKVEVKNINSFRYVKQAIDFEMKRHIEILEKGQIPDQETRGFNEKNQTTYSQRKKEVAQEYRYFPEPDIPPMRFTEQEIEQYASKIPELPVDKIKRYMKDYGIKYNDAFTLSRDKDMYSYYEQLCNEGKEIARLSETVSIYQTYANYVINKKVDIKNISPEDGAKLIKEQMQPKQTDTNLLDEVSTKIIDQNEKSVSDYKSGKTNAIMFLVGQVMKEMKGKADANVVREHLIKKIG